MKDLDRISAALRKMQGHPGLIGNESNLIKHTIAAVERQQRGDMLLDEWIDAVLQLEDMLAICRRVRERLNGGNVVVFEPPYQREEIDEPLLKATG